VLLTRSPLSPVPKDWFSLDLHVLSAPPAFVLSQDQTLREDWFASMTLLLASRAPASFFPRACAQSVSSNQHEVTGFLDLSPITASGGRVEDLDVFTLLSFQRPVLLW
jgi:hypothetical protein